jgi:hypothetical protein
VKNKKSAPRSRRRGPSLATILKADLLSVASRANRAMHRRVAGLQRQTLALRRASAAHRRGLARLERGVARLRDAGSRASARPASGPTMKPAAVRALRARMGMTRERFARVIGVSPGSIFLWETGRARPRAGSLARLRGADAKRSSTRAARGR